MTTMPGPLVLGVLCATILASAHVAHAQTKPTTTTAPKPTVLTAPSEAPPGVPLPPNLTPIFDGKTLDGWTMEPPNATNISRGEITDLPALAKKLTEISDPVSAWLADQLDDATKAALAAYSPSSGNQKELGNALAKQLTKIVTGPEIYDESRFKDVRLRDETSTLLKGTPQGRDLARLNRVLLEDAYPNELWPSPAVAWRVRKGILESLGAGRGVIHTNRAFGRYRVVFDCRHRGALPGQDHRAGVLVFCTPPGELDKPSDTLHGVQFQLPNGGHWDYRAGKNNSGKEFFTRLVNPQFDEHAWHRVEILVDPATGVARMAVAQPVGAKAVEVLVFKDPTAGRAGPFALQMHNRGLFDEFANIAVEEDPKGEELVTTR